MFEYYVVYLDVITMQFELHSSHLYGQFVSYKLPIDWKNRPVRPICVGPLEEAPDANERAVKNDHFE